MEKNAKQLCLEVNRPDNERVPYDSVEETLSEGNRLGKLYSTVYSGRFCPHCTGRIPAGANSEKRDCGAFGHPGDQRRLIHLAG